MSSKADRPGENLWVVVLASSRQSVTPGKPPAYLRPLMGRPALDYVLDAAGALDPAGIIALIGAGSTITKDVPPDALAVGRTKQVNLPGRGVRSRKK